MVRETRHLWIGNLPENVREEQILELFQRHGRVQSVKLLSDDTTNSPALSNGGNGVRNSVINGSGQRATVSFIDIRSASKALRAGPTLSGQSLQIAYHEPGSVLSSSSVNNVSVESNSSPARSVSGDSAVTVTSEISIGSGSSNNTLTNPVQVPSGNSNPVLGHCNNPSTPSTNTAGTNSSNNSYRQQRFPIHGQSDDTSSSSHFYEQTKGFSRGGRGDDHFHGGRGRRESRYLNNNRQGFKPDRERRFRNNWYSNENRFAPPAHSEGPENERTSSIPPVMINNNEPGTNSSKNRIPDSPANAVSSRHLPSKIHQSRSVSESGSSDRGSSVGSRSRSGSRSSVSTSVSSGRSRSPPHHASASAQVSSGAGGSSRFHQNSFSHQRYNRSRLVSRPADSSRTRHSHSSRSPPMGGRSRSSSSSSSPSPHRKVSTAPHSRSRSPSSTKSYSPSRSLNSSSSHHQHSHHSSKGLRVPSSLECSSSIKIRNLPSRSSDTSLKDGLYHEYKKHGKLSWVRILGNGADRHAVVCFKSAEHASRAVSLSQDKLFFGCKIQVTPYQGHGRSSGGEEALGGTEDDNRPFGDDEFATTTPSRTVYVTGLDPSIMAADLRKTFEQYGDIVDAKVRKPLNDMATCSGIIEFVDIASANRAQWVRHAFKARETRISFYRNPVSSSILLDGITGVTEKQITGHCCQFGAISRIVIDSERILALVQFEEISSAQTAFRELKNWIQKGRQLHVDFASAACVRLFLNRALANSGNNLLSPDLRSDSATPPFLSGSPTKNRRSGGRKFSDLQSDRRHSYRNNEPSLGDGKTESELSPQLCSRNVVDHLSEPHHLENCNGRRNSRYNGMVEEVDLGEVQDESRVNGLPTSVAEQRSSSKVKHITSSTKIDLSCHETDSAVVTSSSDIICVESEPTEIESIPYENHLHKHIGGTAALITVNGDAHGATSYESVGVLKSRASYRWSTKSQSVFDGVSSTSPPEPKTETVQKLSPDSGIGNGSLVTVEQFPPNTQIESQVSPVLEDPRRKPFESKIRRSSADSGNIHCSAFVAVNSSGGNSIYPSEIIIPDKSGQDSDDRPSTPLCDENHEAFSDEPTKSRLMAVTGKPVLPLPKSRDQPPLSLPLPEFAQNRSSPSDAPQRNCKSRVSSPTTSPLAPEVERSPVSSPIPESLSPETPGVEASPVPPTPPQSVMPSSAASTEENSTSALAPVEKSLSSFSSPPPAKSTNIDNTNGTTGSGAGLRSVVLGETLPENKVSNNNRSPPPGIRKKMNSESQKSSRRPSKPEDDTDKLSLDDEDALSPPSSDCDASPRRGEEDLTQRLQELYQRFDAWDSGSRSVARSLSYASSNNTEDGTESSRLSLHLDKPWLTRSKAIDLDELRQQPSDITKSLIGKRSVFDDDSQRLESLNDTNLNSTSLSDWRASFQSRSNSTTSISSSTSVPLTPSSASSTGSSNVFPLAPTTTVAQRHHSLSSSQAIEISGPSAKSNSSLPPKPPSTSSASFLPTAGPLPNSIIKRKEGTPMAGTGVSQWAPKDPRLAHKSNSFPSSKIPIAVSTASPQTPSQAVPPPVFRSTSLNANLHAGRAEILPKPELAPPKAKQPGEHPSDEAQKPLLLTEKSAPPPPPGVHQGIPRMVERSLSLDSRKPLASPPTHPATNPCNSIPATTNSNNSSGFNRKISLESYTSKEGLASASASASQRKELEPPQKPKNRGNEVKESSVKEVPPKPAQPLTINSSSACTNESKSIAKFDVSKDESRVTIPHQHSTVGVVSVQQQPTQPSSHLPSSQSLPIKAGSSSSGKGKESNKKEKDPIKKSLKSGSSLGLSKSTNNFKEDSSGSNKSGKVKEKKEKNGENPSSGGSAGEKLKHEHENSRHHHHKEKKKEKEKEKEIAVKEKNTSNEIPYAATASASGEQKKEKDLKVKRRLSISDIEPDYKKQKLEKDEDNDKEREQTSFPQLENSHHSRTKSVSSSSGSVERRESRESSSSTTKEKKEIQKEKSHSSTKSSDKGETTSSPLPPPSKDKNGKSYSNDNKDSSHHRSKSTSSSSSRNHYHGKSEKTGSTSSLHSHSSKDKEKQKLKEKQQKAEKVSSPGGKERENSKPGTNSSSSSQNKHSSSHNHSSTSSSVHHRKNERDEKLSSSSLKSKSKEKGRVSNHFNSDEEDNVDGGQKYKNDKPKTSISSLKSEKRDSGSSSGKPKRDRQKSGGDSSSAPGDSLKGESSSSRLKSKEQKKRRSRVVEDSDSSTDDEERKHHSIFDVVVDEYVSMYDKVKARSNRACKNVGPRKQEEEQQKRQEKIQDSLQLLKKSRAKKDEKKRFSVDSRRSYQNSSEDEDSRSRHERDSSHDFETDRRRNTSPVTPRGSLSIITGLCTSSDEERKHEVKHSSKPSKPKSKSSRDGSIKSEKSSSMKSSRKSSKASPLRSSAFYLTHSDEDSGPSMKKRKMSMKHKPSVAVISSVDTNKSSDDESLSEPTTSKRPSLKKSSFSRIERKSLVDIYTESDNSIQSAKELPKPSHSYKSKKDKSSKQKSMRHLFETSDSSGDEKSMPTKRDKDVEGKTKSTASFSKDSKTDKKKVSHHGHGSSSGSKSSKKKRERLSSEDSKNVTSSGDGALAKKNQPTMEDLLFGPMSNSGSDSEEPPKPIVEERIETPAVSKGKQPSLQDTPLSISSFKKSKSARSRSKQRRSSSLKSGKSVDDSSAALANSTNESSSKHGQSSSEKRKKKHKKDKSKRAENAVHRNEHPLDIDSLFNTPVSSPMVVAEPKQRPIPDEDGSSKITLFAAPPVEVTNLINVQVQPIRTSTPPNVGEEERLGRSMFSSDEDDDDKLKIDISEAIISASGGNEDEDDDLPIRLEPAICPTTPPTNERAMDEEAAVAAANLLEEEEKNRNCLVEQDKAIESILMERKSPPRTPVLGTIGGLGQLQPQRDLDSDYLIKDELKDETAISQEETEDAVAALLKNLGNDDDIETEETLEKRPASPPTIRIIEEVASPALSFSEQQSVGSEQETPICGPSNWFTSASPTKSPKSQEPEDLEIPAAFGSDAPLIDDTCRSPPRKKRLTCEEASLQLHNVLEMAKQAMAESKKMEEEVVPISLPVPSIDSPLPPEKPTVPVNEASEGGASSGDVYDFHDSDDEGLRAIPPAPMPPPAPAPVVSPVVSVPAPLIINSKPESKAITPPRTRSPASSGLLELVIEKLPLNPPQPQSVSQFSPKARPIQQFPIHAPLPQQLKPITIEVPAEPAPIQASVTPVRPLIPVKLQSPAKASPVPVQFVPTTPPVPLLAANRTPPAPMPAAVHKSSIDETIEDVIRNFKLAEVPYSETVHPLPIHPPGRKGKRRSGSKDSDEILSIPTKSRQQSPTRRIPVSSHLQPMPVHVQNQPPQQKPQPKVNAIPMIETRTDTHGPSISEGYLIDPQTGHLTHKSGQIDEAQYVPVSGQDMAKVHYIHGPPPPQNHLQPRGGQKSDLERAGSVERIAPEPQPYQIQIQKNEGLPAILAQQQQHHILQQQIPDSNRRQSPSSAHTPPGGHLQRKDSFGQTRASPPVSSPSFNFAPMRMPTVQSPPTSMPGRMQGVYQIPTSQPGYTSLMRPQQDPQSLRPRHQLPIGQHVPSPGQIQAQLVRIPQIPMATTITKVDARNDELQNRKASLSQPPSTVILTTTSNGPIDIMSGVRLSAPHHLQPRAHEGYISQGPPRIEIGGGIVQPAAGSPKGRVSQQHEQAQQQASQHRMHHIPYEPPMTDVRVMARAPGGLDSQFLGSLPHQGNPYLPYNIPTVTSMPPNQHGFAMRPGSVDPSKQQQPEVPKQLERPSTAHLVPQHLSSPHLGERGSAESPHLVPMYTSRHPIYGNNGHLGMAQQAHHSPIPSAHQHQRQTFTHPFEFDENRMYARSPGYQVQMHHDTREREPTGREDSPFAATSAPLRRPEETPPPAHGLVRYGQQHQMVDLPPAIERGRLSIQAENQQLPPQGDLMLMLLQRYPIVWQGILALKNDSAACQFHFVSGNMNVATDSLPTNPDGTTLPLRISQRMRLETVQLDGVARKLQTEQEHCMLLALPCGRDHLDVLQHSNNLRSGFITYLQLKQAAGIVNVHHQSSADTPSFVIHIFPACEFANENLARIAPDLLNGVADIAHLLIVIATV